jgi:hypothetical protein
LHPRKLKMAADGRLCPLCALSMNRSSQRTLFDPFRSVNRSEEYVLHRGSIRSHCYAKRSWLRKAVLLFVVRIQAQLPQGGPWAHACSQPAPMSTDEAEKIFSPDARRQNRRACEEVSRNARERLRRRVRYRRLDLPLRFEDRAVLVERRTGNYRESRATQHWKGSSHVYAPQA